jgi:transcriptional regulator with XRE-family HTH domain
MSEAWHNRIYVWRVTLRLTQQQAADIAGVSLTTWSRWERGLTEPAEHDRIICWGQLVEELARRYPDSPWLVR